jgi:hypothetical protein
MIANTRMIKLNSMSFLATLNLCCTMLIVWTLSDLSEHVKNDLKVTFNECILRGNVEIREFNIARLCFYSNSDANVTDSAAIEMYSSFIRFVIRTHRSSDCLEII